VWERKWEKEAYVDDRKNERQIEEPQREKEREREREWEWNIHKPEQSVLKQKERGEATERKERMTERVKREKRVLRREPNQLLKLTMRLTISSKCVFSTFSLSFSHTHASTHASTHTHAHTHRHTRTHASKHTHTNALSLFRKKKMVMR
jgi:hypothetical protein